LGSKDTGDTYRIYLRILGICGKKHENTTLEEGLKWISI
jgi:hypothetical protein